MRTFAEKQAAKKAERVGLIILLVSNLIVWTSVAMIMDGMIK